MIKVLLVSSSVKFFGQLKRAADFSGCEILTSTSMAEAKKYLLLCRVHTAVLNCPLCDGFGFDEAQYLADIYGVNVLLFVKNEIFEDVFRKIHRNDIITLVKPNTPENISNALHRLFLNDKKPPEKKSADSDDGSLGTLKLISGAKILLMRQFAMSEAQAHRYIEKRAMDMSKTKKEIARSIIKSYGN